MKKSALSTLVRASFKKNPVPALRGELDAKGKKFGIVVSRFNEFLTDRLLEGAVDTLLACGANKKQITVVSVPGAFEMPLAAQKLVHRIKPDAVIALSVVIRGQTKHFEQVTLQSARGIGEVSQKSGVPVILGMIPAESVEDAACRIGIKQMNKGREWALAAVEMANLMSKLKTRGGLS